MLTEAILLEQNKRLRHELEEANETVRQLRADLASGQQPLPEWLPHLTPMEQSVLRMLIAREHIGSHQMRNALHEGEERSHNLLGVIVCRLRKKLQPHGVSIKTIWGVGFAMPQSSKEIFSAERAKAA